MVKLQRLHRLAGWSAILLFALSGITMRTIFPTAYAARESVRYLYRANHVYILFGGLLNLLLGRYLEEAQSARGRLQLAGSLLLLAAPWLLVAAFVAEAPRGLPGRPMTTLGVVFAAAGVALHLVPGRREAS